MDYDRFARTAYGKVHKSDPTNDAALSECGGGRAQASPAASKKPEHSNSCHRAHNGPTLKCHCWLCLCVYCIYPLNSFSSIQRQTPPFATQQEEEMTDFIELASSSRWLLDRVLGEDDDFAKLEYNEGNNAATPPDDSILNSVPYSNETSGPGPFLSKSAEAELYLLATNFLLCKIF
jgi:hypothetical protein